MKKWDNYLTLTVMAMDFIAICYSIYTANAGLVVLYSTLLVMTGYLYAVNNNRYR